MNVTIVKGKSTVRVVCQTIQLNFYSCHEDNENTEEAVNDITHLCVNNVAVDESTYAEAAPNVTSRPSTGAVRLCMLIQLLP